MYSSIGSEEYLTKQEARRYILDLLKISGLYAKLKQDYIVVQHKTKEEWKRHLERIAESIFESMDISHDGKLQFNELVKPDNKLVEFLHTAIDAYEHQQVAAAMPSNLKPSEVVSKYSGTLTITIMDQTLTTHLTLFVTDKSDSRFDGQAFHRHLGIENVFRFEGTVHGTEVHWTELDHIQGDSEVALPCEYNGTLQGTTLTGEWKNGSTLAASAVGSVGSFTLAAVQ